MIPYSLEWMKVCPFAHWGVVTIPVLLDSWMCKPSLSRECESHHCKGKVPLVHVGSPQAASREVLSQCRVCMSMRSLAKVPCSCCSVPDFGAVTWAAWCQSGLLCSPNSCRPDGNLLFSFCSCCLCLCRGATPWLCAAGSGTATNEKLLVWNEQSHTF